MSMYILEDQDYTQITLGIFVHQEKFLPFDLAMTLSEVHRIVSAFRQQNFEAVNERYKEINSPKPLAKGIMPTPSLLELEKLLREVVYNSYVSSKPELARPFLEAVKRVTAEEHKARLKAEHLEEKRIKEELARTPWQVGDILYTSWGYEQTNVSFYQVTRMVGKTMIEVKQISSEIVQKTGWNQGLKLPKKDSFTGDPIRKKLPSNPSYPIKIGYSEYASRWHGKPIRYSSYA